MIVRFFKRYTWSGGECHNMENKFKQVLHKQFDVSFLGHQPTSYTTHSIKTGRSCLLKIQSEPANVVHLGMANGPLWRKERQPLLLKCPKSLVRC